MGDRKLIFDAVRSAARPGLFMDPDNINALDELLDRFDVPRDQDPDAFAFALGVILQHEGGFVNHPADPGGMTNLGVTKNTWEAWTGRPATEADMRALTKQDVAPLYRKRYWEALRCDEMPPPIALCAFDFGVNAGPARAARYLQQVVGAAPDGQIGFNTMSAIKTYAAAHGVAAVVREYSEARRRYYRQLPTFKTFGKGWLRRVDETETMALRMI